MHPVLRLVLIGPWLLVSSAALAGDHPAVHFAPLELSLDLGKATAKPTALASGDFDADGAQDIACAYATAQGGFVVVFRGNLDAIHPPGAGPSAPPFFNHPFVLSIDVYPQALESGHFDDDTVMDLAIYTRHD